MASVFSHAIAALGLGACFYRPEIPKRVWALGAFYAVLPDADVAAFAFGIPYEHMLGHRGLSHSLFFAAALSAITVGTAFRRGVPGLGAAPLGLFLFLATASHGVLDALTNGGLGVAFWAPFENTRHFFPFQPIQVSPIGIRRFLGTKGLAVLRSEAVWVWIPAAVVAGLALAMRRKQRRTEPALRP
jgi:inner membrane protein